MLSQGNISEIEANKKTFSYEAVVSLARYLSDKRVSLHWLLTGEGDMYRNADNINPSDMNLLNDVNRLSEQEKTLVIERIHAFLDLKGAPKIQAVSRKVPENPIVAKIPISMSALEPDAERRIIEICVYDERASAGLGNYLSGESTYEMLSVDAGIVPPEASMGIRITGNSMEPDIPDNSIVWVKEMHEIQSGQVGIFVLNNEEAFCKRLKINHDKREIYLVSFNPAYKPIKISSLDFLRTIGRVVGEPYIF